LRRDGTNPSIGQELLERPPGLDVLIEHGEWPVDQEEIDHIHAEALHAVVALRSIDQAIPRLESRSHRGGSLARPDLEHPEAELRDRDVVVERAGRDGVVMTDDLPRALAATGEKTAATGARLRSDHVLTEIMGSVRSSTRTPIGPALDWSEPG
jgi:hypothetical protein